MGLQFQLCAPHLPFSKGQRSQNPVLRRKLSQCKIQAPSALMTTELFCTEIKLFLLVLEQFPQLLKGGSIFLPSKEPLAACNVARNFLHLSWQLLNKFLSKKLDFLFSPTGGTTLAPCRMNAGWGKATRNHQAHFLWQ